MRPTTNQKDAFDPVFSPEQWSGIDAVIEKYRGKPGR